MLLAASPCDTEAPSVNASRTVRMLQNGKCDLLKIDVDFGDCDLAEALIHELQPKLVHVEVNPHFPPPLAFRHHFSASLLTELQGGAAEIDGKELPHYLKGAAPLLTGCSVAAYKQVLGYNWRLISRE